MSKYKNKLFSILGDSISTFEGCSEPYDAVYYDASHKLASEVLKREDTWWGRVIEHLGVSLLVNNSFSGSTVCWHPLYQIQSYSCSDERTSSLDKDGIFPDVIIIYMGTNDWGHGFRVYRDERYDPIVDNPAMFMSAYRIMLDKLRKNYPQAELWCVTLAISKCSRISNFSFPYYYGGRHISGYNDAIRACTQEYNCRLIDLYNNVEAYDTLDGFHPTLSGMKTLADGVIRELYQSTTN